jgi:putative CocE/NonD family hydrolase
MLGKTAQVWQDFIDHPDNDDYWRFSVGDRPRTGEMGPGKYSQVNVPTMNIAGWYDQVSQATINNYIGMVQYGPKHLRDKHHLIVGPWEHAVGQRKVGDLDFGPLANGEYLPPEIGWSPYWLRSVELRWYDYWLKGIDNGMMDESPVSIFVMGDNEWRTQKQWPPTNTSDLKFYIHGSGRANSRYGDGVLSNQPPAQEPTDTFVYNPEDPAPTFGGIQLWQGFGIPNSNGPRDQRAIQNRNDVLVYTSDVLTAKIQVSGRVMFNLYAATTATDTDFTAKLVDLHPNGYAQILRDGILRARYRNSYKKQELLSPGTIYLYNIDLWSITHVFQEGHRIQVEISSSNFPKYDRNPNTGSKFGEGTELRKATQIIYHDEKHPSHVVLPVI